MTCPPIPPPEIREVRASDLVGCPLGQILATLLVNDFFPDPRPALQEDA